MLALENVDEENAVRAKRLEKARQKRVSASISSTLISTGSETKKSSKWSGNNKALKYSPSKKKKKKVVPASTRLESRLELENIVDNQMKITTNALRIISMWYETKLAKDEVRIYDSFVVEAISNIGISQAHLRLLRAVFEKIDIDDIGSVTVGEVLDLIGAKTSPFTDQLFYRIIDAKDSGYLDFEEFVYLFIMFCTFSKDQILKFCFDSYDKDRDKMLSEKEYAEMFKHIHASDPDFPGNFDRVMSQFDFTRDGLLDYEEFILLEFKFPMIVHPAFQLQDKMQKCTLGESTWLSIMTAYHKKCQLEEYMAKNGGKRPPRTILQRIGCLLCCFCACFRCPCTPTSTSPYSYRY